MPMSWTPENDRLLLLKLIETHGISVDSNKIVAAWPNTGQKPTARAITERFVKLRQLAGIKVSVRTGGKPGKTSTPRASKYTTPRKRKTTRDSDESDAENYLTDDDSPTKKPTVQSSGGVRGSGGRGRGSGRGGRGGRGSAQKPIKREESLLDLPADPFDADDFEKDAAEAAEIRKMSAQDPFAAHKANMSIGFQGFTPLNGHQTLTGFDMSDASTFDNDQASGLSLDGMMPTHGLAHQHTEAFPMGFNDGGANTSTGRARSARKASAQASEGVSAFIHKQKNEDEADGEKSSGEDSQVSEYHDLDGDYV